MPSGGRCQVPQSKVGQVSRGIFEGVDELIDVALRVKDFGKPPHHKHETSCKHAQSKIADFGATALIADIYDQIGTNWEASKYNKASKENWRFEQQRAIVKTNESKEVILERAIVNVSAEVWPDVKDWVNQVPVASGLVSASADRRRAIDLVHKCGPAAYEFVELKIDSDTPLYAAMEILKYGVLYIFCRQDEREGKRVSDYIDRTKQLLRAQNIHLQVLAPAKYYEKYDLSRLERSLAEGLANFLKHRKFEFEMDFKFMSIPQVPTCLKEIESEATRLILSRAPVTWRSQ